MAQRLNASWLDLMDSSNSSEESKTIQTPEIKIEDCDHDLSVRSSSSRELEIEFNDSENEKKFDKLVNEKKIKSPFKRRLSSDKLEGVKNVTDTRQLGKKSKLEDGQSPIKRLRVDSTGSSSTGSSTHNREYETDKGTLERRQKQIDYGKNTIGYDNYIKSIAKDSRTCDHPKTPPKLLKYSRRAWEGLIKSWRRKLHKYDPASKNDDLSGEEAR